MTDAYRAFLEAKTAVAPASGFDVALDEIHPYLMPHARAIVQWAVRGGRRAIFARFGLHKTLIQIETVRLTRARAGGRGLIVLPLGVRQEFFRDAEKVDVTLRFVRSIEEAEDPDGLYLTNYETVRDGKLDPTGFSVISLDEAAILRGFGGSKTFREFMRLYEGTSRYRFVATATPDPNSFLELAAYAAFLGIMDVGEVKTRFFKRDSEKADALTLHAHRAAEFWSWLATWALLVQAPSDLGFSDEGFVLPPMDVRWHEQPSDHAGAGAERDGQGRMFRDAALGVTDAAREKRDSLAVRLAAMMDLIRAAPDQKQWVLWCDLNAEQDAIERALEVEGITYSSIYGALSLDEQEARMAAWRNGETAALIGKPVMLGCGVNLQQCNRAIFLGIGFKFADFIQALHRVHRFGQQREVRIDLISTEAERSIREVLEAKWARHDEQAATMTALIRERGLASSAMARGLARATAVERQDASGEGWRLVNNDAVLETRTMASDSVGLIVTSIPFSTQYEYSPSFLDFGHNEDNAAFWRQMDFLTPELLRVLQPGRVAVVHVKDRIAPGGLTGLGFQTVQPFHAEAIFHYQRHGFAYLGMKTVVTDVVRENNQTYRLGWTEQCKDGSRMGCGMPEYLLLFRKPPTDRSNGYADVPVVKVKPLTETPDGRLISYDYDAGKIVPGSGYSRAIWQLDAHGFTRSSGNRLLTTDELRTLPHAEIYKRWRAESLNTVYDVDRHVAVGEAMEREKRLPSTFMLLPPHSWHPDVWSDVARMRTLNTMQAMKGQEQHLCPMPLDMVKRLIVQFSMPGELVLDPFMGIGTVPTVAVEQGRIGWGTELSGRYFADAVGYVTAAAARVTIPTLFDLPTAEEAERA